MITLPIFQGGKLLAMWEVTVTDSPGANIPCISYSIWSFKAKVRCPFACASSLKGCHCLENCCYCRRNLRGVVMEKEKKGHFLSQENKALSFWTPAGNNSQLHSGRELSSFNYTNLSSTWAPYQRSRNNFVSILTSLRYPV